jgi:ketosteroid isomerase-like protein
VLRHRLTRLFARYRAQLAVTIISIRVQGALAFDWGWHQLTLLSKKTGRSTTTRTRYLEIWQKGADGSWKIAIFFDNLDVPPQMPPPEVLRAMAGERSSPARRKPAGRRKTLA